MSDYTYGQTIVLTATFATQPTPPVLPPVYAPATPTTLTLTVQSPSGIKTTPAVLPMAGTGNYYVTVVASEAGGWTYRWVGTGAAAGAVEGSFFVDPLAVR